MEIFVILYINLKTGSWLVSNFCNNDRSEAILPKIIMLFVSNWSLLFDLFIYSHAIGRKLSNLVDSTLQTSTHEGAVLISFNFSGLQLPRLGIRFDLDEVSGNFKVSFREIYFQFMFLL